MILFPIAIVWIGFVLYWAIVRNGVFTEGTDEDQPPRRWPRRPRKPGPPRLPSSWMVTPPVGDHPGREGPTRSDVTRRQSRREDAARPERRRVSGD
jgi:hypothetical protein